MRNSFSILRDDRAQVGPGPVTYFGMVFAVIGVAVTLSAVYKVGVLPALDIVGASPQWAAFYAVSVLVAFALGWQVRRESGSDG